MNVVNPNKIINTNEKYISDSKITNKNIYSKIAPPNTFIKKNPNQILRGSKVLKKRDKSPNSNRVLNPYIYNSNIIKNNSISKSHAILNDFKINSSYRGGKVKLIKGNNIFTNNKMNNSHNFIVTPKKILFAKIQVNGIGNGNKLDFNDYKTEKQNLSNKKLKEENEIKKCFYINKNIKRQNKYQNNIDIKEKYDFLLQKTKNLLNNYQSIIDYYQEKEKNDENKME